MSWESSKSGNRVSAEGSLTARRDEVDLDHARLRVRWLKRGFALANRGYD
jgi:hypothetical protein